MALKFRCAYCEEYVTVNFAKVGDEIQCRYCNKLVKIPPYAEELPGNNTPYLAVPQSHKGQIEEKINQHNSTGYTSIGHLRPGSVTLIAFMLFFFAFAQIIYLLDGINRGVIRSGDHHIYISFIVSMGYLILLGLGIFKGQNWARILYLLTFPAIVIINAVITKGEIGAIVLFLIYIITFIFLVLPKSNRYFGIIPREFTCKKCNTALNLDLDDRITGEFMCPECEEIYDIYNIKSDSSSPGVETQIKRMNKGKKNIIIIFVIISIILIVIINIILSNYN